MELTPIKVKIGLNGEGHAKYPNFNQLSPSVRQNMDWSKFIDAYGSGWLYDSVGHKEVRSASSEFDSPMGEQWAVVLVPNDFATAAEAQFPDDVEVINEARCEDFYDNCHAADFPDEEINESVLTGIKLKQDLGQALTPTQQKALDPADPTPGIRTNPKKTWAGYKSMKGVTMPTALKK